MTKVTATKQYYQVNDGKVTILVKVVLVVLEI